MDKEFKFKKETLLYKEEKIFKKGKYNKIVLSDENDLILKIDGGYEEERSDTKNELDKCMTIDEEVEFSIIGNNKLKEVEYCVLYVTSNYLEEMCDSGLDLKYCFRKAMRIKKYKVTIDSTTKFFIKTTCKRITEEERDNKFARQYFIKTLAGLIMVLINRTFIEEDKTYISTDIIRVITSYIEINLNNKICIEDLEKKFHLNKFYLGKMFKERMGVTIYRYIMCKRLESSKRLIEENIPIKDIYNRCGFESYTNFFRAFKKEYSMTPKEYYKLSKEDSSKN